MDTLAERLRWLRVSAGLSQTRTAKLAGLSSRHIGLIENGARPNLTAETAEKIGEVFGCSLDWLLAGKGRVPTARAVADSVRKAAA